LLFERDGDVALQGVEPNEHGTGHASRFDAKLETAEVSVEAKSGTDY